MINKRIKKIFVNLFNLDYGIIEKSEIDTTSEWDSLNHLRLMMEIESEFGINMTPNHFQELTSYKKIENFLNKELNDEEN